MTKTKPAFPARRARALPLTLPLAFALGACSDSPVDPGIDVALIAGTYTMTVLRFDPQGSLPETNVLAALVEAPTLNLTSAGAAQVVMRDPTTSLVVTIGGTFQTTPTGVRIDFASQSAFRQLLFSQRMDLTFSQQAGTLSFAGAAPDGVTRARLIELVPAFANEQLLDPTPGTLSVTFRRN